MHYFCVFYSKGVAVAASEIQKMRPESCTPQELRPKAKRGVCLISDDKDHRLKIALQHLRVNHHKSLNTRALSFKCLDSYSKCQIFFTFETGMCRIQATLLRLLHRATPNK